MFPCGVQGLVHAIGSSYVVIIIAADDLAMQGAKAFAVMALSYLSQNSQYSLPEGLM